VTPPTKSKVEQQTPKTTTAQEGGEYVRTTQLEPSVAMEAKESRMWLYVVVAVIGLAVVASILALRMRRRI
jgi:subtilase family serine protease